MGIPVEQSEVQNESLDSTRKGLTSDAIPDAKASIEEQATKQGCPPSTPSKDENNNTLKKDDCHWYVLRATYGREMKAKSYLEEHGTTAFVPLQYVTKRIKGRIKTIEEPVMQNILFGHGTEKELKAFVYDNVHLPFLRFYYQHYTTSDGTEAKKPQIVPDYQMESFQKIYNSNEADTIITKKVVKKFEKGTLVRVTDGPFVGVVGYVARYKGQQRVGIIIDNILTVTTAYVPNDYIKAIE